VRSAHATQRLGAHAAVVENARMRLLPFSFAALAACLASAAVASEWTPVVSPHGQVFPALVLATANLPAPAKPKARLLGDPNGLIGARVVSERDGQRARLTVRLNGWLRPSTLDVVLPKASTRYSLFPTLEWEFGLLRAANQGAPETMSFELQLDDAAVERKVERVRLRSVNEAPYYVLGEKSSTDLSWVFAAFVDEDHPQVQRLLSEALKTKIVRRFDGYQSRDPRQVMNQVYAIWRALQDRGVRYSSITRTGNGKSDVLSQHVRFIDESFGNAEANCVDGSVLFAAALRKIDLNPALVMVPGHMFLAFELTPGGERSYLETTLIDDVLPSAGDEGDDASFASFVRASERGHAQYQKARSRFGDRKQPEYQIIDIGAARDLGVVPIGARR
jgi:hypothetical protein